jgi:hypothetical protein
MTVEIPVQITLQNCIFSNGKEIRPRIKNFDIRLSLERYRYASLACCLAPKREGAVHAAAYARESSAARLASEILGAGEEMQGREAETARNWQFTR